MRDAQQDVCAPALEDAQVADVLVFEDVTFGYTRTPLIAHASFALAAGECIAVTGGNGAGKSTLLRLALGLLSPDGGEVRLFGTPVDRFRDWHKIGYVPQRQPAALALPVSVQEAVETGLAGSIGLGRRPTGEQGARVAHVLEVLGLEELRTRPVQQLSGGQQQRVLVARALATAPRLLLLDEPTTGMDVTARSVLRRSLEHLLSVEGVAVLYVSHDAEAFTGLADRVLHVRATTVEFAS